MFFPQTRINDRYRADYLLGRGGMGEVWKCFDEKLNRFVVLKVVSPELARARPQHTAIFIDEARIGASLVGHPNVVTVFDIINENEKGQPILAIVMELAEGMSCDHWINQGSKNVDDDTRHYISLKIAADVCKAIEYAHRHNILHRDIKPLNVFISKYGLTKIGDFGISRYSDAVTREHTVWNLRSPAYSAPEQWNDEKTTKLTDIYQPGCTLYHIFTGRLPFEASNVASLIKKHLTEDPEDPRVHNANISEDLALLILRCLSKIPKKRPDIWEIIDNISDEIQQKYRIDIDFDKNNINLIEQIAAITEFDKGEMKKDGNFWNIYSDFNEAISEAIELILLKDVKVKLSINL